MTGILRRRSVGVVCVALVIAAIIGIVAYVIGPRAIAQSGPPHTPIVTNGSSNATAIGAKETTPDGVVISLDRVETHTNRMLFHFVLANTRSLGYNVLDLGATHQFVVAGWVSIATHTIGEQQLSSPLPGETSTYPALPANLRANATMDGWLALDTSKLDFTPRQVLYRYGMVQTQTCVDPHDLTTCKPATLYSALTWDLP